MGFRGQLDAGGELSAWHAWLGGSAYAFLRGTYVGIAALKCRLSSCVFFLNFFFFHIAVYYCEWWSEHLAVHLVDVCAVSVQAQDANTEHLPAECPLRCRLGASWFVLGYFLQQNAPRICTEKGAL